MPEFTNAFSGLKENRKLTHGELVRAIRFMIAAEYEAIQLYTQLAESIDHKLAQEVLLDISNEEKEHAGEFLRLLQVLAPDEQGFYDEGMGETNEKIDGRRMQQFRLSLTAPCVWLKRPVPLQRGPGIFMMPGFCFQLGRAAGAEGNAAFTGAGGVIGGSPFSGARRFRCQALRRQPQ